MKSLLNLYGAQKLSKIELTEILGGGPPDTLCSPQCNYTGQSCYVNGHCGCPGKCENILNQGLACRAY